MIEFRRLSKSYGTFAAVQDLDLQVGGGEVFGFLGPNGAGKTTTIRMMMGILVPSGGEVRIHGFDCRTERVEVQRHAGYLPDTPAFHDYLRGQEILRFVGEMHGLSRSDALGRARRALADFGLADAGEEFAANYSLGMKKKLALACALLHEPEVLVLDEPINGLDPRAAREVQDRVRDYAAGGRTVFLSTHLLDMAERVCTRVGIIHQGRLVASGTPAQVKAQAGLGAEASLEEAFLRATAAPAAQPEAGP